MANLGVNSNNKTLIAAAGGIPRLVRLAGIGTIAVQIEAVAALANLAVNGKAQNMNSFDVIALLHHRIDFSSITL